MTEDSRKIADRLATLLLQARRTGVPVTAEETGLDVATAYKVQAKVVAALGSAGGFKVAAKAGQPQIMAPILTSDIQASPARLACPADEEIGIELEVGFRVVSPLPGPDAPDRQARIADCLELVPVIEIVRTRLAGPASRALKLADNQVNGGLVVGPPVSDWQGRDLGRVQARLVLGDETVLDGATEVPGGNAFRNFLLLEAMVGDHCGGLAPGHVVITGSLNGLPYVRAELEIRGEIAGMGAVSLRLDRAG